MSASVLKNGPKTRLFREFLGKPRAQALKMNGLQGVFLNLSVDIDAI